MLKIGDGAVAALRDTGALRITAIDVNGEVELELDGAAGPQASDQVVERDGAAVYLDPAAAKVLADQVLEVHEHGDHFHFSFGDQTAE